jgi:WXG100 family type VII secretion target
MPPVNPNVNTEAMKNALGDFERALTKQTQNSQNTQDEIAALRAAYTGDTSNVLRNSLETWVSEFGNVIKQLENMTQALSGNTTDYERRDAQNQATAAAPMKAMQGLRGL